MAYTNETPWHGLGTYVEEAPNVEEMLKLAKLDWNVEKRPLYASLRKNGRTTYSRIPGQYSIVRDIDDAFLGLCGEKYTPVQNSQAFKFFNEFVEAGDATMETAGSLHEGKHVWGLARLNQSFTLKDNDKVDGYLLVSTPKEPGHAMVIKFTAVRVVCNNTITIALGKKGGFRNLSEFRMTHHNEFNDEMIETAKNTLGIARETMSEFEKNVRLLQGLNITWDEAIKILAPSYGGNVETKDMIADFDKAGKAMHIIKDAYENAPGAQPGNGWGLLNAVTYYADHLAGRSDDLRLNNAWFGYNAKQKIAVMDRMLKMV